MYHHLRSQKAIQVLNNLCAGISYNRVTHICSKIANAVKQNIHINGVFVPHGIVKGCAIRASADNIDKKVDTYDGKNSFHAMALSVYQSTSNGQPVTEPLDLYQVSSGALTGVPSTCIALKQCNITGSPKPRTSPSYTSYHVGFHDEHFANALNDDFVWMVARYLKRPKYSIFSSEFLQQPEVSDITTVPADTIPINDRSLMPDSTCILTSGTLEVETAALTELPSTSTADPSLIPDSTSIFTSDTLEVQATADTELPSKGSAEDRQMQENSPTGADMDQRIPVWSAYNSLLCASKSLQQPSVIDKAYSLPIINAPAHEWTTLVTTLDQLSQLSELVSGSSRKLVVTLDMDLYKRVLKLEYLDSQYQNKWVACPGAFHTTLCALRCLGRTIEGSGMDDAWVEASLYSSVTVNQIINGSHYSRAIEAHEITLQVLFDLWIEAFFSERPTVRTALEESVELLSKACMSKHGIYEAHRALLITVESLNLSKQLTDFDAKHSTNPMYQWARLYMKQVMTLLQFQRATRQGDWFLHLSSLEKLCTYFFAYNRLDYAQNIPEYVARMYQLQTTDPEIWQDFLQQEFTVNTSNQIPFTRLGIDQAQEHQNKNLKGQGSINGITQSPATLLKFCMCAPELSRIASEAETMAGISNKSASEHHCLNKTTVRRQEKAIANLYHVLAPCNIFTSDEKHLFNITTKEIVPKTIEENILSVEMRGSSAMREFVDQRICGEINLWDRMTKCKVLSWTSSTKEIKIKAKSEILTLRATTGLMSRLLIVARSSREVDMEEVIGKYEFSTSNRTLMKPDGFLHPTVDKSTIISILENIPGKPPDMSSTCSSVQELNSKRCLIVDGMAVVQELMAVKSFENCKALGNAYVALIDAKGHNYDATYVIFDNYSIEGSLKEAKRDQRRGSKAPLKGFKVEDGTKIKDAKSFLGSTVTKDSLTLYLARKLVSHAQLSIIAATRENVLSNMSGYIPAPSSQEEADTLMILYAVEAAKSGYTIHIYSQDTDVLLLALRRVPLLGDKAAMVMGTRDQRRLVLLGPIYNALGAEKATALCKWHALTGCDTTGHIRGKSKKACLEAFLKADPSIAASICALGIGSEPSEDTIKGCVAYLCSLFCKKGVNITEPNTLRWTLFKQQGIDKGVELLPPTYGAWEQHIRRAHCQAAIWEQDLILHPVVPDPLKLGWLKEDNHLVPELSKIPPAPASVVELVRCSCGANNPNAISKCSTARCSCRSRDLVCTELCRCGADTEICQNMNVHLDPEDML